MCFPTDDNPKVPSGIVFGRDPSAAQYFGSGLEIDGDALVNGAGEWDIPMGDEFSIQEGNNAWDFQNMQSNNNSFLQQQLSQQQQQQFESQGFQNGSFVNPLSKLCEISPSVESTKNLAHWQSTPSVSLQWQTRFQCERNLPEPCSPVEASSAAV